MSKKTQEGYAAAFDRIMGEVFPDETFKTRYNIFIGSWGGYVTRRIDKNHVERDLTKNQLLVGRGISLALRVTLEQ